MKKKRSTNVAGASHASKVSSSSLSAHIKRGILTSFDPATYTADVLILEATNTYLQGVPLSYHMDGTSALVNNLCAVLFFDHQNYTDAVILAIYPGAGVGAPAYPPGRVTFVPLVQLLTNVVIAPGVNTYTLTGVNHIPVGALAVLIHAWMSSATVGAWVDITAHGELLDALTLGNISIAGDVINGSGIVPVDSSGKIDIHVTGGNCTVNLVVYGYVI